MELTTWCKCNMQWHMVMCTCITGTLFCKIKWLKTCDILQTTLQITTSDRGNLVLCKQRCLICLTYITKTSKIAPLDLVCTRTLFFIILLPEVLGIYMCSFDAWMMLQMYCYISYIQLFSKFSCTCFNESFLLLDVAWVNKVLLLFSEMCMV